MGMRPFRAMTTKEEMMRAMILLGVAACLCGGAGVDGTALPELVPIGNPGNPSELSGGSAGWGPEAMVGGVDYFYGIAKYPVTIEQYCRFLNAVAVTEDTNDLYNGSMSIQQTSDEEGLYSYSIAAELANRPVVSVELDDAKRFVNWLHNGQPGLEVPVPQDVNSTEDGSYDMSGGPETDRKPTATWMLPTEDEWYKGAYHENDGATGNYWDYPTCSDSISTDDANYGNSVGHITDVNAYAHAPSCYGTIGHGGNVWEWTETVTGTNVRVMGGSFDQGWEYLHAGNRGGMRPIGTVSESPNKGFRVGYLAGIGWSEFPDGTDAHWYRPTASGDWPDAEAEAAAIGCHLVTINSQAENDWLEGHVL